MTDSYKFGSFERNADALLRWQEVPRAYSIHWDKKVSGWWFDACYRPNTDYRHPDEPEFISVADATKADKTNGILAFNPARFP